MGIVVGDNADTKHQDDRMQGFEGVDANPEL
jgi:hypothetical protein